MVAMNAGLFVKEYLPAASREDFTWLFNRTPVMLGGCWERDHDDQRKS
jgi:hypothetical protein